MKPRAMLIRLFACAIALFIIPACILKLYQYRFQPRQIAESTSPDGAHVVEVIQIGKTTLSSVSRLRVRVDGEELFAFVIRGDVLAVVPNPPSITWEDSDTLTASFLGDEDMLTFWMSLADSPIQISWYEGRLYHAQFVKEPGDLYRLKIISDSVEFLGYIPPT